MTPSEVARVFGPPADRREVAAAWARLLRGMGCQARPVAWVESPALAERYVSCRALRRPDPRWEPAYRAMYDSRWPNRVYSRFALGREAVLLVYARVSAWRWQEAWRAARVMARRNTQSSIFSVEHLAEVAARAAVHIASIHHLEGNLGDTLVWRPLLRILRGAGLSWVMADEVVCVPHPRIRQDGAGRLHAEDGPAVSWNGIQSYYFWHGVRVPGPVVERPDLIRVHHVLRERNAEVRRVMIERMGVEYFTAGVCGEMLDKDKDRGGERYLRRIPIGGEEPMVMLHVRCPSTQAHHLLRVPPTVRTCRQAAAWTFGYDSPDVYSPAKET